MRLSSSCEVLSDEDTETLAGIVDECRKGKYQEEVRSLDEPLAAVSKPPTENQDGDGRAEGPPKRE